MEDLYCPQCGETLTNVYDCDQCNWTVPDPERFTDFRHKVKRLRREMKALEQYGEHLEELA